MATITRGYTLGATEQVTNTKLHTLVDSATISSIGQSDFGSGVGLISRGTSAPSDSDQLWIDTSLTPPILRVNDGSNWVPVGEWNVLTNKSGQSMSAGHVVIIDTDNSESVEFTSSAGSNLFRGISVGTVANNAAGVFISHGYVPSVSLEISASAGCALRTSSATGKAEPVSFSSTGIFGVVTTPGTASAGASIWGGIFSQQVSASASQAQMEAASSNAVIVTPGNANWHPGVAKAWVIFNGTGTPAVSASHNVDSSITDNGTGDYTFSWTTDFSGTNYAVSFSGKRDGNPGSAPVMLLDTLAAGTLRVKFFNLSDAADDVNPGCLTVFGDQA